MPLWEIPVEINSSGRLIMRGPSAEAIVEILNMTSDRKIRGHVRDIISFVKVQKDSIRRIDEEDDFFAAVSPIDRLSRDESAAVDGEGREDDLGEEPSPEEEPTMVETEHGWDDESPESVGEVQSAETTSQVAQSVGSDGPPRVGGNEVQADEADQVQDNPELEGRSPNRARERIQEVLRTVFQEEEDEEASSSGQAVPTEEEEEEEEEAL